MFLNVLHLIYLALLSLMAAALDSINLAIHIVPIRLISCLTLDGLKCERQKNGLKLYGDM